jgi:Tfp pilus assembly pilus retraction ATPase PilT
MSEQKEKKIEEKEKKIEEKEEIEVNQKENVPEQYQKENVKLYLNFLNSLEKDKAFQKNVFNNTFLEIINYDCFFLKNIIENKNLYEKLKTTKTTIFIIGRLGSGKS